MGTNNISDATIVQSLAAVKKHGSRAKAALAMGMSVKTLDNHLGYAKAKGLTAETVIRDPLELARGEVRKLKAALTSIHKRNDDADAIREEIYGLSAFEPDVPNWVVSLGKGTARAGIPFAFWSDWHYGEVVSREQTGGANAYNRVIAQARIRKLVESTIRLAKGFAFKEGDGKGAVPGIVCALGGDMISGDIHEELAETNELPPFVCVQEVYDLLVWGIDQLKEHFGNVFVPCVVGNHGRTTRKPRAKNRAYLSYEWNLYTMLERHYANDNSVSFMVPGETDALFRVAGHRFLLTHGDTLGVKGGDGIIGALGPIARGTVKFRNSEYKIGREFDYLIMGHWHQELWIGRTFVNNALKGYDEYARTFLRAEPSRPSQSLWFVHPEFGVTSRVSVYVDTGEKGMKANSKWVEIRA